MKILGFGFCCIAAFLYASRFLCAAIFVSSLQDKTAALFKVAYDNAGPDLTIAAVISLVVGILLIVVGIFTSTRAA